MSSKDPKPEISRLEELALSVRAGEIKLPKFQRPFVWQRADMLKLLDSIYRGYPIGSLLIWHSSQRLTSERNIAGLEVGVDKPGSFPTLYLLDGQQRLTTLCGALFWNGASPGSIWDIHFDLENEQFVYPKDSNQIGLFPLNRLIGTSDFIRQCMKFEHHQSRDKYVSNSEKLLRAIKDYKVAVVKIGDMTVEEVAPIFERINSTGRKLTTVDLMMAATWSNGFDLTAEIEAIRQACRLEGFSEIGDPIILRSISAAASLGINKADIQGLRAKSAEVLKKATLDTLEAFPAALRFLRDHLSIEDVSYIPYGLQLTYLVEIFRLCIPTVAQKEHLSKWFWFTSVTRYFTGANTGQNSVDIAVVRAFAKGERAELFDLKDIDLTSLLFDKFNLKNATSTTFAALLNAQRPASTLNNLPLDGSHLRVKSSRFFAAFAPQPLAQLNISRVIYPYSTDLPVDSAVNLECHIFNAECVGAVSRGDVSAYVSSRAVLIGELVQELTGCPVYFATPLQFETESSWMEEDAAEE